MRTKNTQLSTGIYSATEKATGKPAIVEFWYNAKTECYESSACYEGPAPREYIDEWRFSWPVLGFLVQVLSDGFDFD